MSFVSRMTERILKWRRFRPPKTFEERLSWLFQPYMGTLEDVVLWKNPAASISVIAAVNVVFLLIWYLEIRLLGVIFALALLSVAAEGISLWLVKRAGRNAAARHAIRGSSSSNGAVLYAAADRARQWLLSRLAQMVALREQNPPQFCLVMGVIFFASALLGSMLSGIFLLYLCSMVLLTVPGVAPKVFAALKGFHPQTDSDGEVEGFMPEMSPQVIAELHNAGVVVPSLATERDKISDAWLPDGSIEDGSSDEGSNGGTLPSILDVPLSITDSSSSSSDEEFFPKSVPAMAQRPIPSAPPEPAAGWSGALGALGALGGSLGGAIGSLLPTNPTTHSSNRFARQDSEDSDDFELVDKDNL